MTPTVCCSGRGDELRLNRRFLAAGRSKRRQARGRSLRVDQKFEPLNPDDIADLEAKRTWVRRYLGPAAFGRLVLEAMNPNAKGLSAQQLEKLAHRPQRRGAACKSRPQLT